MQNRRNKSDYLEKLRDPRWQKKRLEIMERDEFTCQYCFDSESTLNVHHCYYVWGKNPWEYPEKSLVTLCEKCHEAETEAKGNKEDLITILSQNGFLADDYYTLTKGFLEFGFPFKTVDCSVISWAINHPETYKEMTDRYFQYLKKVNK